MHMVPSDAQHARAQVGGIRPLLALAESRNANAQRNAVHAIAMLARANPENQQTIVELGGLTPLQKMIQMHSGFSAQVRRASQCPYA